MMVCIEYEKFQILFRIILMYERCKKVLQFVNHSFLIKIKQTNKQGRTVVENLENITTS